MRVTETRLMTLASESAAEARDRYGKSTTTLSSGIQVRLPSDDALAWAEGARAASRLTASQSRGSTIDRARDGLGESEHALTSVENELQAARQLAVQMASDVHTADQRATAAAEIRQMRDQVLATLNSRSSADGSYLFGGSRSLAAPFDAAGNYTGDALVRSIEVAEGAQQTVSVPGSTFTAAGGVNVLATLQSLSTALDAGNGAAISRSIDGLQSALDQVSGARSTIGLHLNALENATDARTAFELQLETTHSRLIDTDAIHAISELAQTRAALEGSQSVATQIFAIARRLIGSSG